MATESENVETVLPASSATPSVARRFVGAALRRWNADTPTVETAQLLVSELVTNVVVHTSSDVRLAVSVCDRRIRIEVTDRDERAPRVGSTGSDGPGGRGLAIVDGVAEAWGSDPRRGGKAVWFELAR